MNSLNVNVIIAYFKLEKGVRNYITRNKVVATFLSCPIIDIHTSVIKGVFLIFV